MHAHQFWWVWSLRFWRYCYLSKTAKFPFQGMDYSPWSSKNLIDWNRLKKFMQIGIVVECMHTNFGGRGLSCFGDLPCFYPLIFSLQESVSVSDRFERILVIPYDVRLPKIRINTRLASQLKNQRQ